MKILNSSRSKEIFLEYKDLWIDCFHLTAYNAKGEDYAIVSVIPPKPEMRKELK